MRHRLRAHHHQPAVADEAVAVERGALLRVALARLDLVHVQPLHPRRCAVPRSAGHRSQLSPQQLQQGAKVSLSPFYANTFGCTPDVLLALARYQARSTAAAVSYLLPLPNWQQPTRLGGPRSRMRVGILSSDLTNHIVGHGTASLLALWKQQRQPIDVYAFALTPSDQSAPRAALEELGAHAQKSSL